MKQVFNIFCSDTETPLQLTTRFSVGQIVHVVTTARTTDSDTDYVFALGVIDSMRIKRQKDQETDTVENLIVGGRAKMGEVYVVTYRVKIYSEEIDTDVLYFEDNIHLLLEDIYNDYCTLISDTYENLRLAFINPILEQYDHHVSMCNSHGIK